MNSSVGRTTSGEARNRALKAGLAAACCALAASACSSNAGKRIAGAGTYRTGSVGTALSRAADQGPAAVSRAQARLGSNGRSPARRAAAAERERAAAPRRTASRPVPNPLDVFRAQAAANPAVAAAEPRPTLQRVAYEPRGLAERALTSRTILAPALTETARPAARAAVPARLAPVNRAVAGWSLSRPQTAVLAVGLLLSILAAMLAAWSAARRRLLAEPRIAAPAAANDSGRPEPVGAGKRAVGPQYVLPLSPAGAQPQPQPRTYSVKAGGAAKLTSTRA